jgi:hypothetical protein
MSECETALNVFCINTGASAFILQIEQVCVQKEKWRKTYHVHLALHTQIGSVIEERHRGIQVVLK